MKDSATHGASLITLVAAMTLALGAVNVQAAETEHPGTTPGEMRYKGAPVPIKPEEAQETVSPKAPPVTDRRIHPREANLL